jgi:branched-chain amino acid transport system substrate-binding protein
MCASKLVVSPVALKMPTTPRRAQSMIQAARSRTSITCVASWGAKGHEALIAELKTRYKEPWMTQNAISTYGDMWVIKDALEKAGKADRVAVAEALRTMDAGPSKYYPLGEIKFDEKGRRIGAGMTIVQWQTGVPVTVFPPQLALAQPFWPKN